MAAQNCEEDKRPSDLSYIKREKGNEIIIIVTKEHRIIICYYLANNFYVKSVCNTFLFVIFSAENCTQNHNDLNQQDHKGEALRGV